MAPRERLSPYLGGPGARWAQALLLGLHIALEILLLVLAHRFWMIQARMGFETWQRALFVALLVLTLANLGRRTLRIGRDLFAALREHRSPPDSDH